MNKTEIQKLLKNAGITDGAAYHRVNHLIDCGWCIGTVKEFRVMLKSEDTRLIQLEVGQRRLLEKLVNRRI